MTSDRVLIRPCPKCSMRGEASDAEWRRNPPSTTPVNLGTEEYGSRIVQRDDEESYHFRCRTYPGEHNGNRMVGQIDWIEGETE